MSTDAPLGSAGMGVAGMGTGAAGLGTGAAGMGAAGTGTAGMGTGAAGMGAAGTGTAGMGAAGMGAGTGAAGMGMAGMGAAGTGSNPGGGFIRGPEPTQESASAMGPYTVDSYTDGFQAPVTYGGGTIYYPTDAEPPFATVVICPGFTALQDSIADWGPFFASHGIVTMTIDTLTVGDQVVQRAGELMEALGGLQAENERAGSPLMGKIDKTRAGLMGWSMGGGGTWISSSEHPELKSAISLAGHNATAGGPGASPNIMVPTFLCAGETDSGILGGGMSQPMYEAIPEGTPKLLYEVAGGDHWICNTPSSAGYAVGRYGLSWQKVFLEGDERYRQFLLEPAPMASDFRSNLM